MKPETSLRLIKLAHTVVWAFFAGCIVAIPVFGYLRRFETALLLTGAVMVEVVILAVNRMRCPLTDIAARYTEDRRDNFDIYLPLPIARHNKTIFGFLFIGGMIFTLAQWLDWIPPAVRYNR